MLAFFQALLPISMHLIFTGIDAGALSQDFIWTAHAVFQSGFVMMFPLFEGQKDHKSISDYDELYDNGMYETLAVFLIQSFMTTGVLCPGLSRPVFNYIVGSPDQTVDNYLDCPDYDDQEIIKKVIHIFVEIFTFATH